jgi:DNA-binding HxlR family transcriptional regulator
MCVDRHEGSLSGDLFQYASNAGGGPLHFKGGSEQLTGTVLAAVRAVSGLTSQQWHQNRGKHRSLAGLLKIGAAESQPRPCRRPAASNRRYLAFVMQLDDPLASLEKLDRVTQKAVENQRSYRVFNFFDDEDRKVLESIGQGEFCIGGMQNKTLRKLLPGRSTQQVSRTIKRLRTHGLVQKTARSYKYYLTPLGREVVATGLRLKQFMILPELAKKAA